MLYEKIMKKIKFRAKRGIKDLPKFAKDYVYIVAKPYKNELFFHGAFNSFLRAQESARLINGVIVSKELL